MIRPQLVINVSGGTVQDVFASLPDLQVIIVDWDADGIHNPSQVDVILDGLTHSAAVSDMPCSQLEELAGSDAEKAIDAACDQGVLFATC